ncbi:ABC transporter substrate-binding protein [Glaciibacter superstes]|uniref:ABC transporter substrate-binding protein n=1 Tax=Glaciibacter superstes TaxID=501023 RepID=UPI000405AFAC|nr:sugar ABC transporter substrate-binding protein [Glaciibacter superstes]
MKRPKIVAFVVAAAATFALVGCTSAAPANDDGKTETISMWSRDSTKGYIEDIVKAFNSSQKGVKVELTIVPNDQFVQKFGAASASGDAPDLTSLDVSRMQYFSSVGALMDLTKRTEKLSYFKDMAPSHMNVAEYDGQVYGVPFSAEASVLFRNLDLFEAAGLDAAAAPTNFAEFSASAQAVSALDPETFGYVFAGASGGSNHFGSVPFIWASDGTLLSDDGKAHFDSPEVTAFLNLYKGLWDAGTIPASASSDTGANATPAFLSGKVGMISSGAFFVNQLLATDPGFKWDISLIPGEKGGTGSFAGGDNLAIPSGSSNADAAWKFIEFATDKQAQTILAKMGVVPVRTDLLDEIYIPLDPRFGTLAEAMTIGTTPKTIFGTELFSDNQGPLATMINQSVFGDVSIADAQQTAQKAAKTIIEAGS